MSIPSLAPGGGVFTGLDPWGRPSTVTYYGKGNSNATAWSNVWSYYAELDQNDHSLMFNRAIISALVLGKGRVYVPAGDYTFAHSVTLYSFVEIRGDGMLSSIIHMANNANCDAFVGQNFATWTGSNDNTKGIYGWTLADLAVDGNSANNTSGNGLRIYGFGYTLENVLFANTANDGIYSEFATAADANPPGGITGNGNDIVAHLTNVRTMYNGGNGINWYGPHDSVWHGVDSVQTLADSGFAAINIRNTATALGGPVQMVNCHGTGASWALRTEAVTITSGCQWEQGARSCVKYTGSAGSNQAANSVMNGDYIFCGGSIAAPVGIEIGDTSPSVAVSVLNLRGSIFNCTSGAIKFTNDGGNILDIVAYATSGNITSGTRNAATQLTLVTPGTVGTPITRIQPHLASTGGGTPTLGALQSGVSTQSISGNDQRGTVTIGTAGASPPASGAVLAIVTFAQSYGVAPFVIVSSQFGVFGFQSVSATGFSLVNGGASALAISSSFFINYFVIG